MDPIAFLLRFEVRLKSCSADREMCAVSLHRALMCLEREWIRSTPGVRTAASRRNTTRRAHTGSRWSNEVALLGARHALCCISFAFTRGCQPQTVKRLITESPAKFFGSAIGGGDIAFLATAMEIFGDEVSPDGRMVQPSTLFQADLISQVFLSRMRPATALFHFS